MHFSLLLKAIVHNIGVILVGFIFAFIASRIDLILGLKLFNSSIVIFIGILLLAIGFIIRVWATYYFYKFQMGVIVLHPQRKLLTSGPYGFMRNPLYLGGNLFIFLGTSLILGTVVGVILTFLHLPFVNLMVKKEEKDLEKKFGKEFLDYEKKVPRWIPKFI